MLRLFYIIILVIKYLLLYNFSFLNRNPKNKSHLLKLFFEDAGGAFIKFGQILALRVDVLPKEYSLEMIDLFDHVKSFPYEEVKRIFKEELGTTPQKIFNYFEKEPFASASFGQVYAAKLGDKKVIVKIQRPGIQNQVKADFFIIDIFAYLANMFFKIQALSWKDFADEFKHWTLRELDYQIEAENSQRIYDNTTQARNLDVVVPKTYHRYTTKKILVQEYIDGIPLSRVLKEIKNGKLTVKDLENRGVAIKKAPRTLIFEMARQYFFDSFFHADPHPGNILLLEKGKIGLIDFGITGNAAPNRNNFAKFVKSGIDGKYKKLGYYFLNFAGEELKQTIESALPADIDQKHIDGLLNILVLHFDLYAQQIKLKMIEDLKTMKKDYAVMVLESIKFTQRYNIKIPKQMITFIRALSIIGFLAKEIDYEFRLTDVLNDFFNKYPIEKIPENDTFYIPYKRINREQAIEKLNNWLAYLLEIDPKLYQSIDKYMNRYKVDII